MKIKKICLLSIGASFLLTFAGNFNVGFLNSSQTNDKLQGTEKAANKNLYYEDETKKDDDFDYQLGVPDDVYISNPGDEFESKDIFESVNAEYKTIDENGTISVVNYNPSPIQTLDTDPNEDNDSFDKASAVYLVGQDEGHYGNWVQWGATINKKTSG